MTSVFISVDNLCILLQGNILFGCLTCCLLCSGGSFTSVFILSGYKNTHRKVCS